MFYFWLLERHQRRSEVLHIHPLQILLQLMVLSLLMLQYSLTLLLLERVFHQKKDRLSTLQQMVLHSLVLLFSV